MTDVAGGTDAPAPAPAPAPSPGALLRRAREARGLHVAALAASLKVPPRRLEALEQDRWDDLPGPSFTRALAQSVCRALKTDPAPVLALLPQVDANLLENVSGRINAPFQERSSHGDAGAGPLLPAPVLWIVAVVLLAAAAVLLWPSGGAPEGPTTAAVDGTSTVSPLPLPAEGAATDATPVPVPADGAPTDAAATEAPATLPGPAATDVATPTPGAIDGASTQTQTQTQTQTPAPAGDAPVAAPAPAEGKAPAEPDASALLVLRASADSWIEVRDASGQVLVSRTLAAGETLSLDPAMPARLTIGNAQATDVRLRGERVDLAAQQRGNIARIELR